MTPKTVYAAFVFLLLSLFGSPARATTIILPTDGQLVDKSPLIVEGHVTATVPVDRGGAIWTDTTVVVVRALKGSANPTIVVREIGGVLGDRASIVYGSPEYSAGETVLLFLSPAGDGTFRTRDLAIGKFAESRSSEGRRIWHRDEELVGTRIIDAGGTPSVARARDAARFEEFIAARAAGHAPVAEYFLDADYGTGTSEGLKSVTSDFTLLSEPSIYRWKLFENGQSISWRSNGSQSGYASGGLTELGSALSAWTTAPNANIRMKYDGTTAAVGGLSTPNGIHEVLFNDPKGEIDGSWNGSSGVVGRGGFNAAKKGGAWTSPFTADPAHPQKTWDTWEILEANLVIQDGVSPAKGIASARLAEIIAHEFGHTLGIGHSGSTNALMYASLTGGGAVLREDDQIAARWLYPAGTAPAPPPPPAPSPAAAFVWTPPNPTTETTISFLDQSTGSATAWLWNFGDGTTSTQRNPYKRFGVAGTYTVTLKASNASGSSQTARSVAVAPALASAPPVSAAFDIAPATGAVGQQISFLDRTTGSPTSWSWNFGDGTTSSQQNPVHVFKAAGTYQVRLTASNGGSSAAAARAFTVSAEASVSRALIAASAESPGVGGSEWRTELALFNDGASGLTIDFTYIPGAGGTILTRRTYLGAGRSVTYASALRDLFALQTATGAIAIDARADWGTASLKVSSRTFTTGPTGTYWQFIPGAARDGGAATVYLTGVESSAAYRTNVGIVNTSTSWRAVRLTLLDATGQTLAVRDETVAPSSFQQQPVTTYFPAIAGQAREGMSLRVTADGAGVTAYASVVDNVSHDPVYVAAAAPPAGSPLTVPAVGRTPGAAGTWWRSDAAIFNPTLGTMSLALRFLPAGTDNRWAAAKTFTLAAGRTVVIRDLLAWFGVASGTGALRIEWSGTAAGPVVTTRTYTTRGDGGTLGQSMDPVPAAAFADRASVVGSKANGAFRTNVGLVNGDDAPATIWVTVTSSAGATLGRTAVALHPRSQVQMSLAALFPSLGSAIGDFVVRAEGAPKLFLYTSVVDNASGDPLYIAGE